MNKENMLKVADAIEAERVGSKKVHLDVTSWHNYNSCGTTACIAGFAHHLMFKEGNVTHGKPRAHTSAGLAGKEYLGLSREQAGVLFHGVGYGRDFPDLVPDMLRWMALNGKVSWERAFAAALCVRKGKQGEQREHAKGS